MDLEPLELGGSTTIREQLRNQWEGLGSSKRHSSPCLNYSLSSSHSFWIFEQPKPTFCLSLSDGFEGVTCSGSEEFN